MKKTPIRKRDILEYHEGHRPGKVEVVPTKPSNSQRDLSIAYSPGVAEPCLEIAANPEDAYRYTAKGNLVAVISNGTAVLGLGDIGPLASKPVMEGKGVLFKIFADIDVFDLELDTKDPDKFVETVKILAPTFGGVNLEDISAPDCFYIEKRLREELDIPIMHDDQHGTAIITGAALLNATEIVGKKLSEVRVVFNGAGASAISCARLYLALGVTPENLIMCDSKGVIHDGRDDLTVQPTLTESVVHEAPHRARHHAPASHVFGQPIADRGGAIERGDRVICDRPDHLAMQANGQMQRLAFGRLIRPGGDASLHRLDRGATIKPRQPDAQIGVVPGHQAESLVGFGLAANRQQEAFAAVDRDTHARSPNKPSPAQATRSTTSGGMFGRFGARR